MIFVTVGTHEQQFNRLVKYIDQLKLDEEVFIQIGYSTYTPVNCKYSKLLSYEQMDDKIKKARIIITHGGPGSIMSPLQLGKIPIVVPRQKRFNEHVNDHQVEFVQRISRNGNIVSIYDINDLGEAINKYDQKTGKTKMQRVSNNVTFNESLEKIVSQMFIV